MKEEGTRVPMEAVWRDKELLAGRRPDDRTWTGSDRSELSRWQGVQCRWGWWGIPLSLVPHQHRSPLKSRPPAVAS